MSKRIQMPQPIALAALSVVLFTGFAFLLFASPWPAVRAAHDPKNDKREATHRAVEAASAFLASLGAEGQEKALYEFTSSKKPNWSNLPITFVERNGVRLADLTKEQRAKAMTVLVTVLSKDGYQKVVDIMDGDQQLAEGKGGGKGGKGGGKGGKGGKGGGKGPGGPMFGADQYYLAIFGKPSETEPWMVQFGGHHLGVNVTVIGNNFVVSPTHTGAQPALFKRDGHEVRPLGREAEAAFTLVNSLDEQQRAQAIIGNRPQQELLLGPGRDGKTIEPKGIRGSALTSAQQAMLLDVIAAWVNIGEPKAAAEWMAKIRVRINDTYFAWSGPTEKGSAAYFRVQGPTVVIEYAPQGSPDHIHTVIRNPEDDYGAGKIKR